MADGTSPSDFQHISGTINTLNLQIQDCRAKLMSAKGEASRLQEENSVLTDRVGRGESRINQLDIQCDELKEEVKRLRLEAWRTSSASFSHTVPSRATDTHEAGLRERQPVGGFSLLPKWHIDYQDIGEVTRDQPMGSDLRDAAGSWKSSSRKPILLREHKWEIAEIAPATADYSGSGQREEETTKVQDSCTEDNGDQPELSLPEPNLGQRKAEVYNDDRNERIDSLRRNSGPPERASYSNPSDPRREPLEDSIHEEHAAGKKRPLPKNLVYDEGFRRKAVCVHCWETSGFCDAWPRCGTCRVNGVKCVRKICGSGLSCRNPRCPCLHPGEWDEKDPEFTVEYGPLPRRNQNDRSEVEKPLGDYYRPGRAR